MEVVSVKFRTGARTYNSEEYFYKSFFEVTPGQIVVIKSDGSYLTAMVHRTGIVNSHEVSLAKDYLVQIVDTSLYERVVKKDKKLQEIVSKMDERITNLSKDMRIYEMFAEEDKEMRELLKIYKEIDSQEI